jgi:undecaprenyl-diphosphatase
MSCVDEEPTTRQALALGLLHGPAELLPVSSSAHTTLLPWLAGSRYARLDGATRKSFELALHAGTAAALLLLVARVDGSVALALDGRTRLRLAAVASAPAAVTGLALRRHIERRLTGPRAAALGLLAGSVAMLYADIDGPAEGRQLKDVSDLDALALGVAQAAALAPGVSRSGATLAAARLRGFGRADSAVLSFVAGLPLLVGAGGFEALALLRTRSLSAAAVTGGIGSFASTLLSARVMRRSTSETLPLAPFAVYRAVLALLVLRRLRSPAPAQ